jgi:hypothetical protein
MKHITTGYNEKFLLQLYSNGQVFDMSSATAVKCILVSKNRIVKYISLPLSILPDSVGADFANSLLVIKIPGTATSDITHKGSAYLEIKISYSSEEDIIRLLPVYIDRGNI